jgi:hypothetical protein
MIPTRRVDLRIPVLQHLERGHDVVDLGAAVIDRVIERLAVADAAAILRRDHDIALRCRLPDVRNVVLVEMTADVLVHPDERRMTLRAAKIQRLEDERRNVEVADAAPVADLRHLHDAVAGPAPCLVGLGLPLDLAVEVRCPLEEVIRSSARPRLRRRCRRLTVESAPRCAECQHNREREDRWAHEPSYTDPAVLAARW